MEKPKQMFWPTPDIQKIRVRRKAHVFIPNALTAYITCFTTEALSPSVPGGLPLYTVDHAPQVQILAFSSLYPLKPSIAHSINIHSTQWINYAPMYSFYTNFMMFCFS